MIHEILSATHFHSLRRQLSPAALADVVKQIESGYRRELGVETLLEYSILAADPNLSEEQRAGLRVIETCIYVLAYFVQRGCHNPLQLDVLWHALADADPRRLEGAAVLKGRSKGGEKTALTLKTQAAKRQALINTAAEKIRRTDPGIKNEALARLLSERNPELGAASTLAKKLPPRRS